MPEAKRSQVPRPESRANKPIKNLLVTWGLIAFNFLVGPAAYPFPSAVTVFYLVAAMAVILLGYLLAFRFTNPQAHESPSLLPSLNFWRFPLFIGSMLSCGGAISSFYLVNTSGRTLKNSIQLTGYVRQTLTDDIGVAGTISNAFGFTSMSCLFMCLIFLRYGGGWKSFLNKASLAFSSLGVTFLLLIYVANANRTAFLYLLLMLMFYVVLFERGNFKTVIRRAGWYGVLVVLIIIVLSLYYILLIAINRTGDVSENSLFIAGFMNLRYKIPDWLVSETIAEGLYKLQWYSSHQIANLDLFFRGGHLHWVDVDPPSLLFWIYQQLARIWPDLVGVVANSEMRGAAIAEMSGGYAWQWYTGFAPFLLGFGIIGSLVVLFGFGGLIGWLYGTFLRDGSILSGLLLLWFLPLCLMLMVYFPNDNFYHSNVFFLLLAKTLALVLRKRHL